MDYIGLAVELINKMRALRNVSAQKNIVEVLHGETFVLYCIANHSEDVLPGEISHKMDVSSARVAAALNSLEKKGLITRQIDKNDRRKILVRITQEGKDLSEKQQQTAVECAANMLELLGEHDAREYVRIIGRLAEIDPECKKQICFK